MQFIHSAVAEYKRLGLCKADQRAIASALLILETRLAGQAIVLDSPGLVKDLLRLRLAPLEFEVFGVLWLTSTNTLIAMEEIFVGTVTQTAVYPREVVRRGLQHNAVGAIAYHNHPSGGAQPSRADELLTQVLKSALLLVDIRLIDHLVVSSSSAVSMAERGLM